MTNKSAVSHQRFQEISYLKVFKIQ